MPTPLNIQGVGNGHQVCNFKMICPLAIPHDDGVTRLHKITTPVVEGSGEELVQAEPLETATFFNFGIRGSLFNPLNVKFRLPGILLSLFPFKIVLPYLELILL